MKKLHLSKKEKMIGGVCGGLAESTGFDVIIFRFIFAISIFFGGTGLVGYLILYAILPKEDNEEYYVIDNVREKKYKLYRSLNNRLIAGVCGGLGDFFKMDSSIVRLIFVALTFAGFGIPVYLVFWLIIPLEKHDD